MSEIEVEKLLGFLLTERDTKINPERCTLTRCMSVLSLDLHQSEEGATSLTKRVKRCSSS